MQHYTKIHTQNLQDFYTHEKLHNIFKNLKNCTKLYNTIHHFTRFQKKQRKTLHNFTEFNKKLSKLYKTVQNLNTIRKHIHNSTTTTTKQHYKTQHNFQKKNLKNQTLQHFTKLSKHFTQLLKNPTTLYKTYTTTLQHFRKLYKNEINLTTALQSI